MKKVIKINFTLTNRWLYTLIAFLIITIIGVGVYASTFSGVNGVGHDLSEIGFPICASGQVLGFIGGIWDCMTPSSNLWTLSGSDVYYNGGKVGIGLTNPSTELEISGTKGIQWSDGTSPWRLGRYIDDTARPAWVYFTKGSGTTYQNLAVGNLWTDGYIRAIGGYRSSSGKSGFSGRGSYSFCHGHPVGAYRHYDTYENGLFLSYIGDEVRDTSCDPPLGGGTGTNV